MSFLLLLLLMLLILLLLSLPDSPAAAADYNYDNNNNFHWIDGFTIYTSDIQPAPWRFYYYSGVQAISIFDPGAGALTTDYE